MSHNAVLRIETDEGLLKGGSYVFKGENLIRVKEFSQSAAFPRATSTTGRGHIVLYPLDVLAVFDAATLALIDCSKKGQKLKSVKYQLWATNSEAPILEVEINDAYLCSTHMKVGDDLTVSLAFVGARTLSQFDAPADEGRAIAASKFTAEINDVDQTHAASAN
ncbi:MAG: type VI secretion system tube protein Hcp [Janthinobacterium lividum]